MSGYIAPGEMMPAWYVTACDECCIEFHATRTEPKVRPPDGELLCGECSTYARGYRAGLAAARHAMLAAVKGLEDE